MSASTAVQAFLADYGTALWVLLGTAVVVRAWVLYERRRRFIQLVDKLPGPTLKDAHPWLGHLEPIFKSRGSVPHLPDVPDVLPFYQEHLDKFATTAGCFRYWSFNPYRVPIARAALIVVSPDVMRQIFVKNSAKLRKEGRIWNLIDPIVGDSILSANDGPHWRHDRKLLAPAFGNALMERVFDISMKVCDDQLLGTSGTIDVLDKMLRVTAEVIGYVAFSKSLGAFAPPGDEKSVYNIYQRLTTKIGARLFSPLALPFSKFPTAENRAFNRDVALLEELIRNIAEERIALGPKADGEKDILHFLTQRDDQGKLLFAMNDIIGNSRMFLFAGHDTSASTMSHVMWELAKNPELVPKLRKEIDPLFKNGKNPSLNDVRQLPYLDAFVKEALRMFAPGNVTRITGEELKIKQPNGEVMVVPPGLICTYSPICMNRCSAYWEDAQTFKPERFLVKDAEFNAYYPFHIGARSCLGQPMALSEIKALIMFIAYHFDVKPINKEIPKTVLTMSMRPNHVEVDMQPRKF